MQESRAAKGNRASQAGIVINAVLCAVKFAVGLITHSVAVMADAANNLSDALGAVVTLFSTRMAQKPYDKEHPFGHGRMEYVGGLIVGMMILFMGVELLKGGIEGIMAPAALTFSALSFAVMGLSVAVKASLYFYYSHVDKEIGSVALKAAAKDSLADVVATGGILLSMAAARFFSLKADGYVGVLVALVVIKAGYTVCKETIDSLLGGVPDKALAQRLSKALLGYEGILGVHDMVLHDYGPGRCVASVHAEVSAQANIVEIHEMIDMAERNITEQFNMPICIHMDPIVTEDEQTNAVKAQMAAYLKTIDNRLQLHDFRRVPGESQVNLIFDVVLPLDFKVESSLKAGIEAYALSLDERYRCVLNFDRDYFR